MFGGLVEAIGIVKNKIQNNDCIELHFSLSADFSDLKIGDSIAVNGVCLTITDLSVDGFSATAVPETLRLTNLQYLTVGSLVNLERSLAVNARIGGHCVQGHVDGIGEIVQIAHDDKNALLVKINIAKHLTKYIVKKGYITLDGMSITVIDSDIDFFTVTFIPHTQAVTIVNQYQVGTKVNIEVDILGKYIEKLIGVNAVCQ
jgi:riboflavin synthase